MAIDCADTSLVCDMCLLGFDHLQLSAATLRSTMVKEGVIAIIAISKFLRLLIINLTHNDEYLDGIL